MINIAGLDKAAVLAALYNGSRPQGLGFIHFDPTLDPRLYDRDLGEGAAERALSKLVRKAA